MVSKKIFFIVFDLYTLSFNTTRTIVPSQEL